VNSTPAALFPRSQCRASRLNESTGPFDELRLHGGSGSFGCERSSRTGCIHSLRYRPRIMPTATVGEQCRDGSQRMLWRSPPIQRRHPHGRSIKIQSRFSAVRFVNSLPQQRHPLKKLEIRHGSASANEIEDREEAKAVSQVRCACRNQETLHPVSRSAVVPASACNSGRRWNR